MLRRAQQAIAMASCLSVRPSATIKGSLLLSVSIIKRFGGKFSVRKRLLFAQFFGPLEKSLDRYP